MPFTFNQVGVSEVKKAILAMRSTGSCGVDGVPITILKQGLPALALPLTHLTNKVIESSVWPAQWKYARVVPILKPGKKPSEVSSYRPVSLLPAVSKLVEKVLQAQLSAYVEENKILPPEQHGFRSGRSVDTALATVTSQLAAAKENKDERAVLAAFDFSAAFDTLDHDLLIRKMNFLSQSSATLLKNYLADRWQKVCWNDSESDLQHVPFGVPQGSVLGPLLFILLTSDLPAKIAQSGLSRVKPSLFADDTSCNAVDKTTDEAKTSISKASDVISGYSLSNRLSLNPGKTQVLYLQGTPAEAQTSPHGSVKLLGVLLDSKLSFREHHSSVLSDIIARTAIIRRLRTSVSRGALLKNVAWALVIGKLQCSAWVTRKVRLASNETVTAEAAETQIAINDLARVLLGLRRAQHVRVEDLMAKSGLPTVNQLVVQQSAVAAWRALRGGSPLSGLFSSFDSRTRGATQELVKATASTCVAVSNMAQVWNAFPELREASSLTLAKSRAKQLALNCRFL